MKAEASEPAGIYVHIPFCHRICPYCDFAVTAAGAERRRAFAGRLGREIDLVADWDLPADTIYLGGGTPSSLPVEDLERIVLSLRARFALRPATRITLEANPEDASEERLRAWRRLGVDTLSLGVQSLDAASLKRLGRRHRPEEARSAVERARAAGFRSLSLDLMYALWGQGPGEVERDLDAFAALEPDHVSAYQLTFHPATPYGRGLEKGVLRPAGESLQAELFRTVHRALAEAGLFAYEVSNFARSAEHRSRHNRKYWRRVPYLGLGPSACSFRGALRWQNEPDAARWEARVDAGERPVARCERLDAEALALEEVMLSLRTSEGIDIEGLRRRHGVDLVRRNRARIERWVEAGLLRFEAGHLRPSLDGLAVADALARDLEVAPER